MIAALAVACTTATAQRGLVFSGGCGSRFATDRLYEVDLRTGTMTDLGEWVECDVEALEFVGDRLIASSETSAATPGGFFDFSESPGVPIGSPARRSGVDHDLAVDPTTGILYALHGAELSAPSASWLYTISLDTWLPSLLGSDRSAFADSIAINRRGEAYAVDSVFLQRLYAVDLQTGDLSLIAPMDIPFCCGVTGLNAAIDFDDQDDDLLWMVIGGFGSNFSRVFTIDVTTGETTFIANLDPVLPGRNGFDVDSLAIIPTPPCVADFDRDGSLTVFDFLAFQTAFDAGITSADLDEDGQLTIFDFLAFQTAFDAGCP
ncbi:MAG: GC-type dockerin domain-anchored protein [Phycisphaerales bacterium]